MQPSNCWIAGIPSSRVNAMPASRLSGSALIVVDRACMPPLRPLVAALGGVATELTLAVIDVCRNAV
ncbi:hypothetical protein [Blastococcus sp. SYSU DS0533]